ncbi:MAG: alanyl-tRNA editing protein [Nitrososphaeria archaeon]
MTELLYLTDSYLKEFEATVVEDLGEALVLDRTAFYPGGGGQPNDTGYIEVDGRRLEVLSVEKAENKVLHHVKHEGSLLNVRVKGVINWPRRYSFMKYHTAIHLIDAVLRNYYGKAFLTGGQIYEDKARIDVDFPELKREMLPELETRVNHEISEGREVVVKFLSRDEAMKIPEIARTKPGQELLMKLDVVRVVEIVGLDAQMDGGTHVRNTREIGAIRMVKFENKGAHNKRIEFVLASGL